MGLTSTKKNIFHTSISSRSLRGKDTLGIAVTTGSCPQAMFQPGNGYQYYIFRNNGTFNVLREGIADICVIAGGGGGGAGKVSPGGYFGGGGGAGGMLNIYDRNFVIGTYTVTIGVGGCGSPTAPNFNESNRNGDNSTVTGPPAFTTITATGGGRGANGDSSPSPSPVGTSGQPGGSGGGAQTRFNIAGSGTSGQGNPGGSSQPASSPFSSNGGGGAGGPAYIEPISSTYLGFQNNYSGVGGDGLAVFGGDPGIPPSFGTSAPPTYRSGRYFAGGGGGMVYSNASPLYAWGRGQPNCGGGGGFTGTNYVPGVTGWPFPLASAQQYTGGGGSGYFYQDFAIPGFNGQSVHGAPGIVIFRYKISNSTI